MAARKNQVLQISLVIAALVIMVLAGLTYWSFGRFQDQEAKLVAAQKSATEAGDAKTQTDKDAPNPAGPHRRRTDRHGRRRRGCGQ